MQQPRPIAAVEDIHVAHKVAQTERHAFAGPRRFAEQVAVPDRKGRGEADDIGAGRAGQGRTSGHI